MRRFLLILLLSAFILIPTAVIHAAIGKVVVYNLAGTKEQDKTYNAAEGESYVLGFKVKLSAAPPAAGVKVTVTTTGTAKLEILEGATLTFTPQNYQEFQKVRVKETNFKEGQTATLQFAAPDYDSFSVAFSIKAKTVLVNKPVETIEAEDLPGAQLNVPELLPKIVGGFLTLIAIAAFFGLLYSGFLYITSAGDTGKAETARKNIVWALSGIIIALLSYGVVNFVANWSNLGFGPSSNTNGNGSGLTDDTNNNNGNGNGNGTATAPTLVVLDENGSDPITNLILPSVSDGVGVSVRLFIESDPIEGADTVITASAAGDFPLELDTTSFTFNSGNWARSQPFAITYNGDGEPGQSAKVNFSRNGQVIHSIQVSLP